MDVKLWLTKQNMKIQDCFQQQCLFIVSIKKIHTSEHEALQQQLSGNGSIDEVKNPYKWC